MTKGFEYKVIRGTSEDVQAKLNALSSDGWRPVAAAGLNIGMQIAVVLERQAS